MEAKALKTPGAEPLTSRGRKPMLEDVAGKEILLWILAAVLLILGIALYQFRSSLDLRHTDPHAIEEIEKAKQR